MGDMAAFMESIRPGNSVGLLTERVSRIVYLSQIFDVLGVV